LEEFLVREMRSQLPWQGETAPVRSRRAPIGASADRAARMWLNGRELGTVQDQTRPFHHLSDVYD
jgi:hypothetical protein